MPSSMLSCPDMPTRYLLANFHAPTDEVGCLPTVCPVSHTTFTRAQAWSVERKRLHAEPRKLSLPVKSLILFLCISKTLLQFCRWKMYHLANLRHDMCICLLHLLITFCAIRHYSIWAYNYVCLSNHTGYTSTVIGKSQC